MALTPLEIAKKKAGKKKFNVNDYLAKKRFPIEGRGQLKGLPWDHNPSPQDVPAEASDSDRKTVIQQSQQQQ